MLLPAIGSLARHIVVVECEADPCSTASLPICAHWKPRILCRLRPIPVPDRTHVVTGLYEHTPVVDWSGHAAAFKQKGDSSRHMRSIISERLLTTVILFSFRLPRCAIRFPSPRITIRRRHRVSIRWAAVKSAARVKASPEWHLRSHTFVSLN
jgi:hypothetical protein